jgi:hypothetical protein
MKTPPPEPQLLKSSISLNEMLTTNSGAGNVIRRVFTKLKKQLAPQTDNPKPKALVLPKLVTFLMPAPALNVPVV